jgi:hypothetical protein
LSPQSALSGKVRFPRIQKKKKKRKKKKLAPVDRGGGKEWLVGDMAPADFLISRRNVLAPPLPID